MKSENYTPEEIHAWSTGVNDGNLALIKKVVSRMKVPPAKRMMNQYFDHWRMAIKMKKLMRYHLNKCNN